MSFEPTASERAVRKDEHLDLAVRLHGQERPNAFDDVSFMHHALPGTATGVADTGTTVCGVRWQVPFYINAMTGGTQATAQVNAGLARAAAETGVAIACGSQHIALREPERANGFQVIRREAPDAFVLANVGPTVTGEQALRAVEMLQADALQVHLNVAQELIMPEGDRDFRDWAGRIAAIADAVPVPVVAKEVDRDPHAGWCRRRRRGRGGRHGLHRHRERAAPPPRLLLPDRLGAVGGAVPPGVAEW